MACAQHNRHLSGMPEQETPQLTPPPAPCSQACLLEVRPSKPRCVFSVGAVLNEQKTDGSELCAGTEGPEPLPARPGGKCERGAAPLSQKVMTNRDSPKRAPRAREFASIPERAVGSRVPRPQPLPLRGLRAAAHLRRSGAQRRAALERGTRLPSQRPGLRPRLRRPAPGPPVVRTARRRRRRSYSLRWIPRRPAASAPRVIRSPFRISGRKPGPRIRSRRVPSCRCPGPSGPGSR